MKHLDMRMFVPLCLIAVGWVFSGSALRAQSWDDVEVRYGVKGGVGLSDIQSDQTSGSDRRQGFVGGGFASVGLPQSVSLQGEVLYVQRGDKLEVLNFNEEIVTSIIKADYIDLPLFVQIEVPLLGASMFPYLGGVLSLEVNEDASELVPLISDDEQVRTELREELQQTSLLKNSIGNFAFGVDFLIEGSSFNLLLDVRLTQTVSDVGDEIAEIPSTGGGVGFINADINTIMIMVGMRF